MRSRHYRYPAFVHRRRSCRRRSRSRHDRRGATFGRITGRKNVQRLRSRAEDIPLGEEPFRVTTIGQAFHWMDRGEVLRRLAILIADGGGLALVNAGKRRPQESWEPVADQIVAKFLGPRTRHPKSNPQEPEHEPALVRSECFSDFTTHGFPSTIARDINSIIGYVYSRSSSARPLFGDNAKAFEAELTKALLSLNPAGFSTRGSRPKSSSRPRDPGRVRTVRASGLYRQARMAGTPDVPSLRYGSN
jgi:hypothetical protein